MLNWFYQALDLNLSDNIRDIILLAAQKAPTLQAIAFGESTKERKLTYYEEARQEYTWVIDSAFWDAVTLWPIDVSDEFWTVLFENHLIQVESEQMIVDSVVKTPWAMTFTVKARWQAGSTAVAHAISSSMVILWIAEPEGVVSNSFAIGDRVERENYFQEMTTNIQLTYRAVEQSNKDRDDLYWEEKVRRLRKHIQNIDSLLRVGLMAYDGATGQHTVGWYEQLISTYGGQTQALLGYANGSFSYTDRKTLLFNLSKVDSNAHIIHCNAQSKEKILNFIPDIDRVDNKWNSWEVIAGMPFAGWVSTPTRDGRILSFYIDNKMVWNQFNLVNFSNMQWIPRKALAGTDKMFELTNEPTNSALISETMRSEFSLELVRGNEMAVCKNI